MSVHNSIKKIYIHIAEHCKINVIAEYKKTCLLFEIILQHEENIKGNLIYIVCHHLQIILKIIDPFHVWFRERMWYLSWPDNFFGFYISCMKSCQKSVKRRKKEERWILHPWIKWDCFELIFKKTYRIKNWKWTLKLCSRVWQMTLLQRWNMKDNIRNFRMQPKEKG